MYIEKLPTGLDDCQSYWKNFIWTVPDEGVATRSWRAKINEYLKEHNCVFVETEFVYTAELQFETEEDAIVFRLKWA